MKKLFLLFVAVACISIGVRADVTYSFGTNGTVTISDDGKTAVIHTDPDHTLNTAPSLYEIKSALANVESITFDETSIVSGSDLTAINGLSKLTKLDMTGATFTGTENFYVGSFTAPLEELIMDGMKGKDGETKDIEIANIPTLKKISMKGISGSGDLKIHNNSKLDEVVLINSTFDNKTATFNDNGSNLGVILPKGLTTSSTLKWKGEFSTFDTYDQDFTQNATEATGKTKLVITGSMSVDDAKSVGILASCNEEIRLLDMSGVTLTDDAEKYDFPFGSNSRLVSVALPQGLPDVKEDWVKNCSNLYAAITYDNTDGPALRAYVGQAGRLKNALIDFNKGNGDIGSAYISGNMSGLNFNNPFKKVKLSGTLNGVDVSRDDETLFTENGNVGFSKEAIEEVADSRVNVGTKLCVALKGCIIEELDLSDAYIPVCTDMTLSRMGYADGYNRDDVDLRKVVLPTDSRMNTIPAFMFRGTFKELTEICIPSNYEIIKTGAFAKTNMGFHHIWTTSGDSDDAHTVFDNGAVRDDGTEYVGYNTSSSPLKWGTYTFSSNLKLIESYAFGATGANVKDVYVLATEAPECHVDAFNTKMYAGNNGFEGVPVDGIITRDSYQNGGSWITMLHYPAETVTPNTQRYTDVTRRYSIATGMRDGKGGIIYFPAHDEFFRAYQQGTTGFLWNAWDPERLNGIGFAKGNAYTNLGGWSTDDQGDANKFYNTYYAKNPDAADNVFYITNWDGVSPAAQNVVDYWTKTWDEGNGDGPQQLYPQAKTEDLLDGDGNKVTTVVPKRDENGNIIYKEVPGGTYVDNFVQKTVTSYEIDSEGTLVKDITWVSATYSWEEVSAGNQYVTDGEGNYYTYSQIVETQYWAYYYDSSHGGVYTKSDGGYRLATESDPEDVDRYKEITVTTYVEATSSDSGPFYTPEMETVNVQKITEANDYRGWHQFVLVGTALNTDEEIIPYRSYITDNDWWTICVPYDLTRGEMKKFFGSATGNLPYLSRLLYVVRNVKDPDYNDQGTIWLCFSKNLMNFTYGIREENGVKYATLDGKELSDEDDNTVVLHAGVPYMIRPNIDVKANRQFRIYKNDDPDLYEKLQKAGDLSGSDQRALVEENLYTVPCYTINNDDQENEPAEGNQAIDYRGKEVENAMESKKYTYTFVGSFYNGLLPQYAYFLGWDTDHAAFFYNRVNDTQNWRWANETAIIIANFDKAKWPEGTGKGKVTPAASKDPARWKFEGQDDANHSLNNDDYVSATGAKVMPFMYFGVEDYGTATGIEEAPVIAPTVNTDVKVYNVSGQLVGTSLRGLSKGMYIVNGKKYVVK